jgi:hypothetical protein
MRTVPVKYSAGPLPEGCEPLRLISITCITSLDVFLFGSSYFPEPLEPVRQLRATFSLLRQLGDKQRERHGFDQHAISLGQMVFTRMRSRAPNSDQAIPASRFR